MNASIACLPSTFARCVIVTAFSSLLAACGGGGGGGGGAETIVMQPVTGQVIGAGVVAGALVCADANANGRCDAPEAQARTDAAGTFQFDVPAASSAPLVAEVVAGSARAQRRTIAVYGKIHAAHPVTGRGACTRRPSNPWPHDARDSPARY